MLDPVKPKVLAPGMYAIDVEPIPPRNRNNIEVHLEYLKHLKESVGTLCEIVEEARELLEYVIGTCLKDFNKRDRKIAITPLNRKKKVTLMEPGETSTNNSQTHVEQQKMKKTNEHMILSGGVKDTTAASGSKPRSNTKKDRTLPAKSDMKKVEAHYRNNESSVKQKNHVDSSISFKRTVINSNSTSVCKTCNKYLMSFYHDKCVVRSLKFVKKSLVNWKVVYQCRISVTAHWYQCKNKQEKAISTDNSTTTVTQSINNSVKLSVEQIILWYLDSDYSKHMTGDRSRLRNFVKKFTGTVIFENDHFGAIMGYGDYVIGDSVISIVYYVEGLGHNLFSVEQFCDSDLEVAFRKIHDEVLSYLLIVQGLNEQIMVVASSVKSLKLCVDIFHQKSVLRTPQQNGVIKRRKRTLVEAARTMLIFSKALMFLWAEAVATACYTQNRSLIHTRHNKNPYELVHDKKPDLKFLRVFWCSLLPNN
ncbi:integrase, catalytic region, zinc finger, CCHC-type containing protein [Tanacetum coccineum]